MKALRLSRGINLEAGVATDGMPQTDQPRRFSIDAYDGGTLPVDGFDFPVIVDLASLAYPESMPLVVDHQVTVESTLGTTDQITNDGQTLTISGLVTATFPKPLLVLEQHDKGQRWQASIGVRVNELQEVPSGTVVVVNKQQFRGPVLVARNSEMYETSVLPAGADWTTQVNLAAKAATLLKGAANMPAFEEWLSLLGIDVATLDEENLAALSLAYDAYANPSAMMVSMAAYTSAIRCGRKQPTARWPEAIARPGLPQIRTYPH